MDIIARLKCIADLKEGDPIPEWLKGPNGWGDHLSKMCRDAIAEIEHLRSVAGAVSQGQTFAEIRKDLTWADVDAQIKAAREKPVLKAFDGA